MKKVLFVTLFILINVLTLTRSFALEGYTTVSGVNIRKGAGINYEIVVELSKKNTVLNIVSETLYNKNDKNCSSGWYKLNYNNEEAYICALYATIGSLPGVDTDIDYDTTMYEAKINGVNIYVRSKASSSSDLLDILLTGTNVKVIGDKVNGTGCSSGWYKINYHKNQTGYVCSKYVLKREEMVSTNAEYEQQLKNLGFPETYIPYLVKLHELHPTWQFIPLLTGIKWDKAVEAESARGVSLINTENDAFRTDNIPLDGEGWYQAKPSVIAYYLDPRNFLTEKFIFMFERLNYDYGSGKEEELNKENEITKKYYESVTNIFKDSFLNTDEYKYAYIDAGFKYNVSPVHLASRTANEGAAKETYVAVRGDYADLYAGYDIRGYYNFYNIGAYYKDEIKNSPVLNGLLYACGTKCGYSDSYNRPWDTRIKAIYGGASQIASGYIAEGQHTLYLQRFNVHPEFNTNLSLFTHQYQTNILAPVDESATIYAAYLDMSDIDFINEEFVFEIPVYLDMPEVVNLPSVASTVNTIEKVMINNKEIKTFDKDILEFKAYVDKKDEKYNLQVELTDQTSTVTGTGELNLTQDETVHNIVVTAEDGSTRTYKITIVKVDDTTTIDDILGKLSVKVTNNIMHAISPNTLSTTLIQSINKQSAGTTVVINEKDGSAASNGSILKTGQTIKLTTPSGETKTFTITVIGDISGDGEATLLDLLKIQKHLLKSNILTGYEYTAGDTNGDAQITILDLLRVQKHILKSITL